MAKKFFLLFLIALIFLIPNFIKNTNANSIANSIKPNSITSNNPGTNALTMTTIKTTSTTIPANQIHNPPKKVKITIAPTTTIIPEGCGIIGNHCPAQNTNYTISKKISSKEVGGANKMGVNNFETEAATVPPGITNYFNLTIKNNDPANALAINSSICIPINAISFNQYANGWFNNFKIFDMGGNVIDSWLEGNTACNYPGYATNAFQTDALNTVNTLSIWIKLPAAIPANSELDNYIALGFGSMTTNFMDGTDIGESPVLTCPNAESSGTAGCAYGKYDNGANVFSFYQNFNGTSLPSNWTDAGTVGYTINNGLTVSGAGISGGGDVYVYTTSNNYGLTANDIVDWFGTEPASTTSSQDEGAGYVAENYITGWGTVFVGSSSQPEMWKHFAGEDVGPGSGGGYAIYSTKWSNTSSAAFYTNYGNRQVISGLELSSSPLSIGVEVRHSGATLGPFYWARYRTLLAVNPIVTNGTVINVSSSPNSTAITLSVDSSITLGESNTIQASCPIGDLCNILIDGVIEASENTTSSYLWVPTTVGISSVTAMDSKSEGTVTKTSTINPSNIPSSIDSYILYGISNVDPNNALQAGTAICIPIQADKLAGYANGAFDNFKIFDQNGTIINSWLEGNTPCNSPGTPMNALQTAALNTTEVSVWIKLPTTIDPNATYYLALGFGPMASNLMNGADTGESPVLTCPNVESSGTAGCAYGKYDNGANVFSFYQNFNGTSLPSNWTDLGTAGYTINNGLTVSGSGDNFVTTTGNYGLTSNYTVDWFGTEPASTTSSQDEGAGYVSQNYITGWGTVFVGSSSQPEAWRGGKGETVGSGSGGGYAIYSTKWSNSSSALFYVNYIHQQVLNATDNHLFSGSQLPIGIGVKHSGATLGPFYWVRYRPVLPVNPIITNSTIMVKIVNESNVLSYIPIIITNYQSSPTNQTFQQLIDINSSSYSGINTSWDNVEFTTGPRATGDLLQAWVQSNATSSAVNTPVWVKLVNPIPGNGGHTVIYMDIMSNTVMTSTNSSTGEAPYLSSTYALHDNGAHVFNFYSNFTAPELDNSTWTVNSSTVNLTSERFAGYVIGNGITLYANDTSDNFSAWTASLYLNFTNPVSTDNVVIDSISYIAQVNLGQYCLIQYCNYEYGFPTYGNMTPENHPTMTLYNYNHISNLSNSGYGQGTYLNCTATDTGLNNTTSVNCESDFAVFDPHGKPVSCLYALANPFTSCPLSYSGIEFSVFVDSATLINNGTQIWSMSNINGTAEFETVNGTGIFPGPPSSCNATNCNNHFPFIYASNSTTNLGWGMTYYGGWEDPSYASMHLYAVRTRAMPPNDIMPTATFG